jgi:cytochrome o ubiquinol oxidase subunit 2
MLLGGCRADSWPVMDPGGAIALAERDLLLFVTGVTLIVVIPVFVLTVWVVTRYRAGDAEGPYRPNWTYSKRIDLGIWAVAGTVAAVIGVTIWWSTHRLDPYRPVAGDGDPLRVEAIAEDWKWVFIYPEQGIATVNELVFPAGRPLQLRITSDTVMNALYIPGLASQIYAMAGMETRLNAIAEEPRTFVGRNAQFSGEGFPEQRFTAKAVAPQAFRRWVAEVGRSSKRLDAATYDKLRQPGGDVPVRHYAAVEPGLFDRVVARYGPSSAAKGATDSASAAGGGG